MTALQFRIYTVLAVVVFSLTAGYALALGEWDGVFMCGVVGSLASLAVIFAGGDR